LQKFLKEGCPNCEGFLSLAHSQEAVEECTSQVYEGLIALADPSQSWVAKWQRLDGYVKGVYAVKVMGTVRPSFLCPSRQCIVLQRSALQENPP
jgi:transcription elongation factor SPT4